MSVESCDQPFIASEVPVPGSSGWGMFGAALSCSLQAECAEMVAKRSDLCVQSEDALQCWGVLKQMIGKGPFFFCF